MVVFLSKIIKIIICITISYVINETIKIMVNKQIERQKKQKQKTITNLLLNITKYIIIIITLLIILSIFGINITSLLAGVGLLGMVIGLAFQDLIKDVISGISIVLEDQYDIGDLVEINGFMGTVIDLSIRSTKIKNIRGEVKIASNSQITEVINYSKYNPTIIVSIPISYEIDNKKVDKVINNIIKSAEKNIKEIKDNIEIMGLDKFEDSYQKYNIKINTKKGEQFSVKRKVNRIIKEEFDKEKIEIPYNVIEVKNG